MRSRARSFGRAKKILTTCGGARKTGEEKNESRPFVHGLRAQPWAERGFRGWLTEARDRSMIVACPALRWSGIPPRSARPYQGAAQDWNSENAPAGNGKQLVGLGRVELPTRSLGNCCSIHLSYSPVSPSVYLEFCTQPTGVVFHARRFGSRRRTRCSGGPAIVSRPGMRRPETPRPQIGVVAKNSPMVPFIPDSSGRDRG